MTPWWNPFEWFGGPPAEVPGAAPAPASGALRVLAAGFNRLDPNFWGGSDGALGGCENDAHAIAKACAGAASRTILAGVHVGPLEWRKALLELATLARPGDRVVIWYSGHGGDDLAGDGDEAKSEYLCLPRGPYPEWSLQEDLRAFRPGVSVLFGSDSCHSAGQIRGVSPSRFAITAERPKALPLDVLQWAATHYREQFKAARAARESREEMIRAAELPDVLALTACREEEVAYDGRPHGAFTGAMLDAARRFPGAAVGKVFSVGPAKLTKQHPQRDFVTPGGERVWNARAFA